MDDHPTSTEAVQPRADLSVVILPGGVFRFIDGPVREVADSQLNIPDGMTVELLYAPSPRRTAPSHAPHLPFIDLEGDAPGFYVFIHRLHISVEGSPAWFTATFEWPDRQTRHMHQVLHGIDLCDTPEQSQMTLRLALKWMRQVKSGRKPGQATGLTPQQKREIEAEIQRCSSEGMKQRDIAAYLNTHYPWEDYGRTAPWSQNVVSQWLRRLLNRNETEMDKAKESVDTVGTANIEDVRSAKEK